MVSIPVSPYCELARWLLDRLGIPYEEDCHAPLFHTLAARGHGGGSVVSVLDTSDASLIGARDVVNYYEVRCPKERRLYPEDAPTCAETGYAFEAARFNPHHPAQARYCGRAAEIAARTPRAKRIPADTCVFVATLSAMFDPEEVF